MIKKNINKMRKPQSHGIRDQIKFTKAAHKRDYNKLIEMDKAWYDAGAVCCPGCMFGNRWLNLVKKQQRRLDWIVVLENKLERDSGGKSNSEVQKEVSGG